MKLNTVKTFLLVYLAVGLLVPVTSIAGNATMSEASDLATVQKEVKGGANINGKFKCAPQLGCKTYLSRAAFNGDVDVIKFLLGKGAKVNDTGFLNQTPLTLAAARGHLEAVEVLLSAGGDPKIEMTDHGEKFRAIDIARKEGGQATDPAVKERYEKIIKLLEK